MFEAGHRAGWCAMNAGMTPDVLLDILDAIDNAEGPADIHESIERAERQNPHPGQWDSIRQHERIAVDRLGLDMDDESRHCLACRDSQAEPDSDYCDACYRRTYGHEKPKG